MVTPEMILIATPATPAQAAANPDVQASHAFIDATNRRDSAALHAIIADEFVLRVPGRSPISGEYHGLDGMERWYRVLQERSAGTYAIARVMIELAMEGHIHLVATQTATRSGNALNAAHIMVLGIEDGRITESQFYEEDQYAVDAFWS